MKHVLCLFLAVAFSLHALAREPSSPTKFSPGDPALTKVERDVRNEGLDAKWVGSILLKGTLVLEFRRVPPEDGEPFPDGAAFFEPDAESLARLPAALNNHPLAPRVIFIERIPLEVLTPLLGPQRARAIVNRKIAGGEERYEFPVTVTLTSLTTSRDCNRRNYSMQYSGFKLLKPDHVASAKTRNMAC